MKLLMATSNRGKLGEVRALLAPGGVEVVGLGDLDEKIEIVEDADTFEGNARKKALTLFRVVGLPVLADDSGLMVEALDGAPGVYSARFAGEDATDAANNEKLLSELRGLPDDKRAAAFICCMVLVVSEDEVRVAEGRFTGRVAKECRGGGGFGYDPVFIPDGWSATLAESTLEQKNRISHRALALKTMLPHILALSLSTRGTRGTRG
jgi:XTP/dITP diphosphohydrolase